MTNSITTQYFNEAGINRSLLQLSLGRNSTGVYLSNFSFLAEPFPQQLDRNNTTGKPILDIS